MGFDIVCRKQRSVAHLDETLDAFRPPDVRKWSGTRPGPAVVLAPNPEVAAPFRCLVLLVPFLEDGIRGGHLLEIIGRKIERRRPRGMPVASLETHKEVAILKADNLRPATKPSKALEIVGRIHRGRHKDLAELVIILGRSRTGWSQASGHYKKQINES